MGSSETATTTTTAAEAAEKQTTTTPTTMTTKASTTSAAMEATAAEALKRIERTPPPSAKNDKKEEKEAQEESESQNRYFDFSGECIVVPRKPKSPSKKDQDEKDARNKAAISTSMERVQVLVKRASCLLVLIGTKIQQDARKAEQTWNESGAGDRITQTSQTLLRFAYRQLVVLLERLRAISSTFVVRPLLTQTRALQTKIVGNSIGTIRYEKTTEALRGAARSIGDRMGGNPQLRSTLKAFLTEFKEKIPVFVWMTLCAYILEGRRRRKLQQLELENQVYHPLKSTTLTTPTTQAFFNKTSHVTSLWTCLFVSKAIASLYAALEKQGYDVPSVSSIMNAATMKQAVQQHVGPAVQNKAQDIAHVLRTVQSKLHEYVHVVHKNEASKNESTPPVTPSRKDEEDGPPNDTKQQDEHKEEKKAAAAHKDEDEKKEHRHGGHPVAHVSASATTPTKGGEHHAPTTPATTTTTSPTSATVSRSNSFTGSCSSSISSIGTSKTNTANTVATVASATTAGISSHYNPECGGGDDDDDDEEPEQEGRWAKTTDHYNNHEVWKSSTAENDKTHDETDDDSSARDGGNNNNNNNTNKRVDEPPKDAAVAVAAAATASSTDVAHIATTAKACTHQDQ